MCILRALLSLALDPCHGFCPRPCPGSGDMPRWSVLLGLAGGGTAVVPRDPKTAATGGPFTVGRLARKWCVLQWTCPCFLQLKYKRRYSGASSRIFCCLFSHVCYDGVRGRSRVLIRGFPPEPLKYFIVHPRELLGNPWAARRRALPTMLYVPLKGRLCL